ncbi:MAG: hypothetical protein AAGI51_05400 [Pseudomonadota bacterium]
MSASDFEAFAEAVAARPRGPAAPPEPLRRMAVLGGLSDARLLAALGVAEGVEVTLFSAYGAELAALRGGVALRGAGPVGSYPVDAEGGAPSIRTTASLDEAVAGAEAIFLTGPTHKKRTYAMVLADHLRDGQALVLAPGRSFSALETAWLLRAGGCEADVVIVEAQAMPFWWRAEGSALALSPRAAGAAATVPAGRSDWLERLAPVLGALRGVPSAVHSGFSDGSGLVEAAALVLGGPAVGDGHAELPFGAEPLAENQTFRALLGDEHLSVIAALAEERRRVAARFGVRDLPSDEDWLEVHAGALRGEGARGVPTAANARLMLRDALAGSLAPLVDVAGIVGEDVPTSAAMLAMGSAVLGGGGPAGRSLSAMGVGGTPEEARKKLEALAGLG